MTDHTARLSIALESAILLHASLNPHVADDNPNLARQVLQNCFNQRQAVMRHLLLDLQEMGSDLYDPKAEVKEI